MQDTDSGVWHKQTSERFPRSSCPEAETTISDVVGASNEIAINWNAPFVFVVAGDDSLDR